MILWHVHGHVMRCGSCASGLSERIHCKGAIGLSGSIDLWKRHAQRVLQGEGTELHMSLRCVGRDV
jgi:hypothetical protein